MYNYVSCRINIQINLFNRITFLCLSPRHDLYFQRRMSWIFVCSVSEGERWLFVLLIIVELLPITLIFHKWRVIATYKYRMRCSNEWWVIKEKFEDTERVGRRNRGKIRRKGQIIVCKNITQKTIDWATRIPLHTGSELLNVQMNC